MKQNLHIHTTYCDGKDTPEQIVQEAIAQGFDSIGFSEHTYNPHSAYPHQMLPEHMEAYRADVLAVKAKYEGRIDVFCGLEDEYFSPVCTEGYDYLIGSVHYLEVGGDGMAFAETYFETLTKLPGKKPYDILSHFDLAAKNNEKGMFFDETSKQYLGFGFEAIHSLQGKIPLFEVNTGAISRGYRSKPYPRMEFLKEFCRCGFGVILTSDCHDKASLSCFYEQAAAIIRQAGFRSKWILTRDGFREVAL